MMDETFDQQEMLTRLKGMYEKKMPFNRLLGIRIDALTPTKVTVSIDMRKELVGTYMRQILYGGVISSVLDLTGGLIASVELLKHLGNIEFDEIEKRLTKVGTIDMRVDYLRTGAGIFFMASGSVLRKGNKVAVIRTEICNDQNVLIAAGTGTYLVG